MAKLTSVDPLTFHVKCTVVLPGKGVNVPAGVQATVPWSALNEPMTGEGPGLLVACAVAVGVVDDVFPGDAEDVEPAAGDPVDAGCDPHGDADAVVEPDADVEAEAEAVGAGDVDDEEP